MPHRLFVLLFGILFIGLLPGSARQSPDKIWHKLDSIQNYRTEFTYTVTLPLTDSEIIGQNSPIEKIQSTHFADIHT